MKSIEKLRAIGRNMAKGLNLENYEECNLLLIIADEIEREIAEKYTPKPDPVKELLEEFVHEYCTGNKLPDYGNPIYADYADKIRELLGGDDDD